MSELRSREGKVAFTSGDPAGIGPDIIQAWLAMHPKQAAKVAVIGPALWLQSLSLFGATAVPAGDASFVITPGQPSLEGAYTALSAMERAALGVKTGEFSSVVTGPVSKSWLQKVGYPFPGQTEFFAARWDGEPTMAFCGGRLRVVLLTWHIPLKDVGLYLKEGNFARAVKAADELARADGIFTPRIAVCGLNPHAGEEGLLGMEERDVIDPILDRLRLLQPDVQLSRCLPGDTVFARTLREEFDVIIALYHDQGLAPLKTIAFDEAVNVTLGLPFIRTSPDHGTAFGLAGTGQASPRSFVNAVRVAQKLVALRAR